MHSATLSLSFLTVLGVFALAPSTADSVIAPAAQGSNGYSLSSLQGRHGFTYQGSSRWLGLIASSGRIDFDGNGNLSAQYTTSVGGTAYTGNFTGTYTVNANGTGSVILNLPQNNALARGDFVLVDHGKATFFTSTDAGYSVVGRTERM